MSEKNINFNGKKNLKSDFFKNKKVIRIDDINVNKTLVSGKESYSTKNSFKYSLFDIMIVILLDHYV